MSLGHPAGVPAKVPFSVRFSIVNNRKSPGHRPVDPCLSRRVSPGHPAGVPGIFLSLCALFFPEKHADFSHRRPTSQDFRRRFFWRFRVISDQARCVFASLAKKKFTSLAIWGCAIRIASHIAVASRDLGH